MSALKTILASVTAMSGEENFLKAYAECMKTVGKKKNKKQKKAAIKLVAQRMYEYCCDRRFCLYEFAEFILIRHPNIDVFPGIKLCLELRGEKEVQLSNCILFERTINTVGTERLQKIGRLTEIIYEIAISDDLTFRLDMLPSVEPTHEMLLPVLDMAVNNKNIDAILFIITRDIIRGGSDVVAIIKKYTKFAGYLPVCKIVLSYYLRYQAKINPQKREVIEELLAQDERHIYVAELINGAIAEYSAI